MVGIYKTANEDLAKITWGTRYQRKIRDHSDHSTDIIGKNTYIRLGKLRRRVFAQISVDRLYMSRKEGGREVVSVQDSVDVSIQNLEDFIRKGI